MLQVYVAVSPTELPADVTSPLLGLLGFEHRARKYIVIIRIMFAIETVSTAGKVTHAQNIIMFMVFIMNALKGIHFEDHLYN